MPSADDDCVDDGEAVLDAGEDLDCDDGDAAIDCAIDFEIDAIVLGGENHFVVRDVPPGARVQVSTGTAGTAWSTASCGATLEIQRARLLVQGNADASGTADLVAVIPTPPRYTETAFQALDLTDCEVSARLVFQLRP